MKFVPLCYPSFSALIKHIRLKTSSAVITEVSVNFLDFQLGLFYGFTVRVLKDLILN